MRVVLLSEVFAQRMGYLENILPKYLARAGADVHVVTFGLPPYYKQNARNAYRGFADICLPAGSVEMVDGYTLHVIPHRQVLGHVQAVALKKKLAAIRPKIVQTTAVIGWLPLQAASAKALLGYKLFTGCHYHSSVFPLAGRKLPPWHKDLLRCRIERSLPGWMVSLVMEKCYAIAPDCADVAVRFFGVPNAKVEVCPLGVDTDVFVPCATQEDYKARGQLRRALGCADSEIVCIYTGRFTNDKNPLLLALAIAQLRAQGEAFRGLFVGNGPQSAAIQSCDGCIVHSFVPVNELPPLFRASDIGVWPTQESTSMLDAGACGLPIVANDTMSDCSRIDGNGVTYRLNDLGDLVRVLAGLKDQRIRARLGQLGAEKMFRAFSWRSVAQRRLRDYEQAARKRKSYRSPAAEGHLRTSKS